MTVRTLEKDFPYGKSSWSGFRDGSRLPTPELIKQVVTKYVPEPVMRARHLTDGLRLLEAAQQAAQALEVGRDLHVSMPEPRRADPVVAAFLRLDDARLRQIEAMQKLAASERRRAELEDTVSFLQERCTLLESERDRAREDAQTELQHELQMSREYRRQADEKLDHARRAEEKAYQLRLAAEKQVTLERMALRRLDQDLAPDSALPPQPGPSIIQELNLPPLHQIHEFLEAKQRQLDAQDDELNDLGEQIGLGGRQPVGHETQSPSRILQGRVVDGSMDPGSQDVPKAPLDNPEKPHTSRNASGTQKAAEPPYDRPGQSTELMIGLKTVTTPAALSTVLSRLLQRAGQGSIKNLTQVAFPGSLKDDLLLMAVMRWIDGDALPETWPHLESLVRVMGATDREVVAFHQAYTRVIENFPSGDSLDLADLPRHRRLLPDILRRPSRPGVRARHWVMAVAGPCTVTALTTGYTAGLQAAPGPGGWKLVGYGALTLLALVLVLMSTVRLAVPFVGEEGKVRSNHAGASVVLSLLATPIGLALPWVIGSDVLGRWFANLVGLV
ncbi:hypothetical protein ACWD01_34360 [Streptomyces sp. NPDC002835]